MSFDSVFKSLWTKGRKIDPLSHRALEAIVKFDSRNVKNVARGLAKVSGGEGSWLGARFNDLGDEAAKNEQDPARGIGRAAATVGAIYGGYAALGGGGAEGVYAGTGGAAGAGYGTAESASVIGGGAEAGGGLAAADGGGAYAGTGGAPGAGYGTSQGADYTGPAKVQKMMSMMRGLQSTQPQQPEPYRWQDVEVAPNPYLDEIALSSRQAKQPADSEGAALEHGARGDNVVDMNGVQMAAIRELTRRVEFLRGRIAKLGSR